MSTATDVDAIPSAFKGELEKLEEFVDTYVKANESKFVTRLLDGRMRSQVKELREAAETATASGLLLLVEQDFDFLRGLTERFLCKKGGESWSEETFMALVVGLFCGRLSVIGDMLGSKKNWNACFT